MHSERPSAVAEMIPSRYAVCELRVRDVPPAPPNAPTPLVLLETARDLSDRPARAQNPPNCAMNSRAKTRSFHLGLTASSLSCFLP